MTRFNHGIVLLLVTFGALSGRGVRLTSAAASPAPIPEAAQNAGLKIVVIAGEDAVNIIQQKTAVAPVIEVRDRNDLPVSGATVTFTIGGANTTFAGGAQTVTVTTNAAGRAVATQLSPLTSGTLKIQATAAYQGQTATATISQTNVLTSAQAAAVGAGAGVGTVAGVAAGGTAAATAGGLSTLAIGGIAGGAGAGALIAARAAGVGGSSLKPCAFTVLPTSFTVASTPGFNGSVNVGLADPDCEPQEWAATSNASFIQLGDSGTSGRGATTLTFFVLINAMGDPQRTGTLTVAGQTVTVTQNARCAFTVTPSSVVFPRAGGSVVFTVIPTPAGCENSAWTVSTISSGITLSPAAGTGNGSVTATAAPIPFNPSGPNPPYTGNLSIANVIVPFVQ